MNTETDPKKHLKIDAPSFHNWEFERRHAYLLTLAQLANAEATLVAAGVRSALPHFIAIVKELEYRFDFTFELMTDEELNEKRTG